MADGTVDATSLNLRDAPSGNILGVLPEGAAVAILATDGAWMQVTGTIAGVPTTGWVSTAFIATGGGSAPGALAIPSADTAQDPVTVAGGKAIGPGGAPFAIAYRAGFSTMGVTTLASYLSGRTAVAGLAPSVVRAVQAVSANEGRLEAINSYDDAFLSFGLFQWTAGGAGQPGELAGLLALLQQSDASVFQSYFGQYGLGVAPGAGATGFLTLGGAALQSAADKAPLRSASWAYRLWRAGHDPAVRDCELALAASRIGRFIDLPVAGHTVGAYLTSEYGIALVLDEHVNRPGHVPSTLAAAIAALPAGGPDLASWGDAEEAALIAAYVTARDATNMTDAANRATRIADCVHAGTLSEARGSFVATLATV